MRSKTRRAHVKAFNRQWSICSLLSPGSVMLETPWVRTTWEESLLNTWQVVWLRNRTMLFQVTKILELILPYNPAYPDYNGIKLRGLWEKVGEPILHMWGTWTTKGQKTCGRWIPKTLISWHSHACVIQISLNVGWTWWLVSYKNMLQKWWNSAYEIWLLKKKKVASFLFTLSPSETWSRESQLPCAQ